MKYLSKLYTVYLHPLVVLLVFIVTSGAYILSFYNWGSRLHSSMILYIEDFLHTYIESLLYIGLFAFCSYYVYWIMKMYHMKFSKYFGVLAICTAGYFTLSIIWQYPVACTGACAIMMFLIAVVSARFVQSFWDMVLSLQVFLYRRKDMTHIDSLEWITWFLPAAAYGFAVLMFYGLDRLFDSHYINHLFVEDYALLLNYMISCLILYSIRRKLGMRTLVNIIVYVVVNLLMVYMFFMQSNDIVVSVYLYAHKLVYLIILMVILDLFPSEMDKSLNWLVKN